MSDELILLWKEWFAAKFGGWRVVGGGYKNLHLDVNI